MQYNFNDFRKNIQKKIFNSRFLKKKISIVTNIGSLLKQTRYIYDSGAKNKNYIKTLIKASFIK